LHSIHLPVSDWANNDVATFVSLGDRCGGYIGHSIIMVSFPQVAGNGQINTDHQTDHSLTNAVLQVSGKK